MNEIKGKSRLLFGRNKDTNELIFITKPTWDCGWYWSFGYLGNKNCHYHLDGYAKGRNINMHDALLNDYELADNIKNNLWVFCELALSIYTLKESAELFGRGGSHMTSNPCRDIIKNPELVKNINEVVLPAAMQKFWDMLENN